MLSVTARGRAQGPVFVLVEGRVGPNGAIHFRFNDPDGTDNRVEAIAMNLRRQRVGLVYWAFCGLLLLSAPCAAGELQWGHHIRSDCGLAVTAESALRVTQQPGDGRTVTLHDISSGRSRTVIREDLQNYEVMLSPSCRYIAYRTYDPKTESADLHVVTLTGEKLVSRQNVFRHFWGKGYDGEEIIAYIAGTRWDSQGTWLVNVETGVSRKVFEEGHDLDWSPFDRSFYVWNVIARGDFSEVQRVDTKTWESTNTPFHGIHFSPGGTYYFSFVPDGDGFRLFRREFNESVPYEFVDEQGREMVFRKPIWIDDSKMVIGSDRIRKIACRIIDAATGQVWEVKEDVVGFADSDGKELLVLVDGTIEKRRFEDCATLIVPAADEDDNSGDE